MVVLFLKNKISKLSANLSNSSIDKLFGLGDSLKGISEQNKNSEQFYPLFIFLICFIVNVSRLFLYGCIKLFYFPPIVFL